MVWVGMFDVCNTVWTQFRGHSRAVQPGLLDERPKKINRHLQKLVWRQLVSRRWSGERSYHRDTRKGGLLHYWGVQISLTLVKNHQKFSIFQDTKGVMIKRQYLVLDAETSLGGGGSLVFLWDVDKGRLERLGLGSPRGDRDQPSSKCSLLGRRQGLSWVLGKVWVGLSGDF